MWSFQKILVVVSLFVIVVGFIAYSIFKSYVDSHVDKKLTGESRETSDISIEGEVINKDEQEEYSDGYDDLSDGYITDD